MIEYISMSARQKPHNLRRRLFTQRLYYLRLFLACLNEYGAGLKRTIARVNNANETILLL